MLGTKIKSKLSKARRAWKLAQPADKEATPNVLDKCAHER